MNTRRLWSLFLLSLLVAVCASSIVGCLGRRDPGASIESTDTADGPEDSATDPAEDQPPYDTVLDRAADRVPYDPTDPDENDDGEDVQNDAAEDLTTTDLELVDEHYDADLDREEAGPDDAADDISDADTCVVYDEVCDGRDNDCDDVPDNGINCGTCPSDFGTMALIVRDGGAAYCIDVYEAARDDATLANEGVSANIVAHSTAGVLPWSNMSIAGARQACTAAGKSLCTQEQWQTACGGIALLAYPYSDTYDGTICNGLDARESTAGANGARPLCVSSEGAFDMSGNLAEWVESEFAMGGSFNSNSNEMRCDQATVQPDTNAPGRSVGFRCCSAAVPPG